jgi:CheY-like chemotaxis protein
MANFNEFLQALRGALNHLYDPDYLRRSPLASWLDAAGRYDTSSVMQKILADAIEAMRPGSRTVGLPLDQHLYDILLFRYVQQSSQDEVAHQFGISTRQVRRLQSTALEALGWSLWRQFDLSGRSLAVGGSENSLDVQAGEIEQAPADDFAWLKNQAITTPANPDAILEEVRELVSPLVIQYRVDLQIQKDPNLPKLAVHPVALRQALLSLLGEAIRNSSGGTICLIVQQVQSEVEFDLSVDSWRKPGETKGLSDARQIAELSGGRLEIKEQGKILRTTLRLPATDLLKVLVIDDNENFTRLVQRYSAGTRFHMVGLNKPEDAIQTIQQESIQIIVLDVMMPNMDGWSLLGRLRRHPDTGQIPVVICTILAQEELALSLGASGFIQKPVRREAFLQMLGQVAGQLGRVRS